MEERLSTFISLAKDFDLTPAEVRKLALHCGIPTRPRDRYLTQQERDRIYDAWLTSRINTEYDTEIYSRENNNNNNENERWIINDEMILIDTSSLLWDGAETFLKIAVPELLRTRQKIIVPLVVMTELNRKAVQNDNPELSRKARNIINLILEYRDMGAIAIYGDSNDGTFADNVFHKVVTMFARNYNLIVITNDRWLGQDLMTMGHLRSVNRKKISVCKLNRQGELCEVEWEGGNL